MKFVCERCHTKYSIADEKVRGKVLKVRCKTCTNVITVRETGATIDDAAAAGREPAVTKSGSFDEGAAPTVANAAAIAKAAARSAKPAGLPAEALFAPGTPAAAPPPRRPTPPPLPPLDDVEWYLAVDGAQTGPFSRARLVDKILVQPKEADVHIWNSTFDAWKPPKEVAEVDAEILKRRAAPVVPPPPVRRQSGALPLVAPSAGGAHGAAVGAGMAAVDSGGHASKLPARPKKNGTVPGLAVSAATASAGALSTDPHPENFGLGDLLGDGDGGLTPSPALAAALANGPGLFDPLPTLTPPPSAAATAAAAATAHAGSAMAMPAPAAPAVVVAPSMGPRAAKGKPVKLLLGAAAVVAVLCGIVLFWMFRKPTTSVAASPPPSKSSGTDFAGLAEKLAKEEAEKTPPPPPPPVETPPPVVDVKSVAGREPPGKAGRGKKAQHKSTAPPPLSPTSPPPPSGSPSGLTAEQRAAASRFGESTGREVRVPTSNAGGGARSTPAQGDISRVINNNRQGIQTCYQRALLRDNTLTHGKVTVRVSIGLSGRVKSVSLDAPAQFRALEPCIRDVMSRWAFPPSSEEYGTEFPVVLQGNN